MYTLSGVPDFAKVPGGEVDVVGKGDIRFPLWSPQGS